MTPRSKRYFQRKGWKSVYKLGQSIVQYYLDATKPIPKYPPGTIHPGGPAVVGAPSGPEIIHMSDGQILRERIFPRVDLPTGKRVMPDSIVREGLYDVTITNVFTRHAKMTVRKVNDRANEQ
jgi:hypothetical protein